MKLVNRSVLVLKPTVKMLDWINSVGEESTAVTPEEAQEMANAYLLPDFEDDEEQASFIAGDPIVFQPYDALAGYSADDTGGQAGSPATSLSSGMRLFRTDPFLPENAGAAAGCREYDDLGALPGTARRRGDAERDLQVLG
jgi:hypothetical protein